MRQIRFALLMVVAVALAAAPLARAFAMAVPADDSSHSHCGSMGADEGSDGEAGDDDDKGCSQMCGWACSMSHALGSPAFPCLATAQPEGASISLDAPLARSWPKAPIRPPIS